MNNMEVGNTGVRSQADKVVISQPECQQFESWCMPIGFPPGDPLFPATHILKMFFIMGLPLKKVKKMQVY